MEEMKEMNEMEKLEEMKEAKEAKEVKKETKYKLTKTELIVLKFVVQGLNNNQIAEKMNISFHTAKAHVSSILYKMQARNKVVMAVKAVAEKLVTL